jgi:hypothetical protein
MVLNRDALDTGFPGYRISGNGRILGLTTTSIFLVKYQISLYKTALKIINFCKH